MTAPDNAGTAAAAGRAVRPPIADFPITVEEFLTFCDFFYAKTGMRFAEAKRYFVDRRIADRARARACGCFRDYFALLIADAAGSETQELINLLTVNETYFFRENHQFEALVKFVLPEIAARKRAGEAIRIWSLPCSTGEEAYSIALAVLDGWAHAGQYRLEIHGSDVDTRVLAEAAQGIYGERALQYVGPQLRAKYFKRHNELHLQVLPKVREMVAFSRLNITSKADLARFRGIDVVFCRNLLIYFDDVSRREAVASLFNGLADGGFLFLGHSEEMSRMSSLFTRRRVGQAIVYQRPSSAG